MGSRCLFPSSPSFPLYSVMIWGFIRVNKCASSLFINGYVRGTSCGLCLHLRVQVSYGLARPSSVKTCPWVLCPTALLFRSAQPATLRSSPALLGGTWNIAGRSFFSSGQEGTLHLTLPCDSFPGIIFRAGHKHTPGAC